MSQPASESPAEPVSSSAEKEASEPTTAPTDQEKSYDAVGDTASISSGSVANQSNQAVTASPPQTISPTEAPASPVAGGDSAKSTAIPLESELSPQQPPPRTFSSPLRPIVLTTGVQALSTGLYTRAAPKFAEKIIQSQANKPLPQIDHQEVIQKLVDAQRAKQVQEMEQLQQMLNGPPPEDQFPTYAPPPPVPVEPKPQSSWGSWLPEPTSSSSSDRRTSSSREASSSQRDRDTRDSRDSRDRDRDRERDRERDRDRTRDQRDRDRSDRDRERDRDRDRSKDSRDSRDRERETKFSSSGSTTSRSKLQSAPVPPVQVPPIASGLPFAPSVYPPQLATIPPVFPQTFGGPELPVTQLIPQLMMPSHAYAPTSTAQPSEPAQSPLDTEMQTEHSSKAAFRAKVSETLVHHASKYLQKGVIANKDDFKLICRNLTHKILQKEEKHGWALSHFSADKVKKFMDDYMAKKAGKKKKKKT